MKFGDFNRPAARPSMRAKGGRDLPSAREPRGDRHAQAGGTAADAVLLRCCDVRRRTRGTARRLLLHRGSAGRCGATRLRSCGAAVTAEKLLAQGMSRQDSGASPHPSRCPVRSKPGKRSSRPRPLRYRRALRRRSARRQMVVIGNGWRRLGRQVGKLSRMRARLSIICRMDRAGDRESAAARARHNPEGDCRGRREGFYEGAIASDIAATSFERRRLLEADDLADTASMSSRRSARLRATRSVELPQNPGADRAVL